MFEEIVRSSESEFFGQVSSPGPTFMAVSSESIGARVAEVTNCGDEVGHDVHVDPSMSFV